MYLKFSVRMSRIDNKGKTFLTFNGQLINAQEIPWVDKEQIVPLKSVKLPEQSHN